MRIGITGHSNLHPESVPLVADAIRDALTETSEPLVGVSCLARGADQVFARVVLEGGGELEVVLPAADYQERKVKPDNRAEFTELIGKANHVTTMPYPESNRDAYLAASEHVLSAVDAMIAVWDGQPADGRGGTGDVVKVARERGISVTVVWPEGARRMEN
ncbi:hypothetical protein [Pseudonocardia acaciae]|uniref:hypothetical protein n=1 Tax=Pseudonocardia acaciae TaxID=551276 RepID=UPI00048BC72F|nr:hypothetical protein [Pseudonocardia acaciae]